MARADRRPRAVRRLRRRRATAARLAVSAQRSVAAQRSVVLDRGRRIAARRPPGVAPAERGPSTPGGGTERRRGAATTYTSTPSSFTPAAFERPRCFGARPRRNRAGADCPDRRPARLPARARLATRSVPRCPTPRPDSRPRTRYRLLATPRAGQSRSRTEARRASVQDIDQADSFWAIAPFP
jgi:hypothetical protein